MKLINKTTNEDEFLGLPIYYLDSYLGDDNSKNESTGEYDSYIKAADLIPLQNKIIKEPILVNLLEGNWEYDIAKFYNIYESSFYNENYEIVFDYFLDFD